MAYRSQDVIFFPIKLRLWNLIRQNIFFFNIFYSDDVDFTQNFSSKSSKGDLIIDYGIPVRNNKP